MWFELIPFVCFMAVSSCKFIKVICVGKNNQGVGYGATSGSEVLERFTEKVPLKKIKLKLKNKN